MKKVDFLIIGGSAAGTTAAEVIRSLRPNSSITIVTDELHEEYSRVLLPHYIRGKVVRDQVFLKKPEWYTDKKIELVKGARAEKLDSTNHILKVSNGEEYQYGKVLIAVGGNVIKLNVPGSDLDGICYMRTVEDADRIVKVASQSRKGVIIGGGFIGLEFASCFKVNGVEEIVVLVRDPYYWEGKLDEDSSKVLVSVLAKNGIKVLTGEEIDRFDSGSDQSLKAITKSGKNLPADVVGIGVGIKSEFGFLEGSGVKVDKGIVTNEYLETNVPDVYAAGDCTQFWDVIFEREHMVGNWANATSQGNTVGKNMADARTVFETASSYSINFFDGACSFIGVTDESFASKIVSRGSVESGKMARIFIKDYPGLNPDGVGSVKPTTRIVGATVINDPSEVGPLTSAVKGKVDVSAHVDKLSNADFDLKEILN